MHASTFGHLECVKVLLVGGAQANRQDEVGTVQEWIQGFWKGGGSRGKSSSPARWYVGAL